MVNRNVTDRIDFDQWAWRRLTAMVNAGCEDLRHLRNRFGLQVQGRLIHASALTKQEREEALHHIQQDSE